jgi:hypothetical protein
LLAMMRSSGRTRTGPGTRELDLESLEAMHEPDPCLMSMDMLVEA